MYCGRACTRYRAGRTWPPRRLVSGLGDGASRPFQPGADAVKAKQIRQHLLIDFLAPGGEGVVRRERLTGAGFGLDFGRVFGPAAFRVGNGDTLLECVFLADSVGFRRGRLAQRTAEVQKVFLQGRAFGKVDTRPFLDEPGRRQFGGHLGYIVEFQPATVQKPSGSAACARSCENPSRTHSRGILSATPVYQYSRHATFAVRATACGAAATAGAHCRTRHPVRGRIASSAEMLIANTRCRSQVTYIT